MNNVTFVIPIGPDHVHLAQRAIDSVNAQTVPCDVLTMVDAARVGPGALRNAMLAKVQTPFVVFLDADDWIEPTFAEETLLEFQRIGGDKYIFTDWIDADNRPIAAPCLNGPNGQPLSVPDKRPYCGGTWHVITALLPTDWARAVGGFDEKLPAVEDTDFFLKLCTTYRCGHRLARPLFHYAPGGGRAAAFHAGPDYQQVMGELTLRYGGRMGCCGDNEKIALPIGQQQAGDVLAMALWQGNRTEYGRVTGRVYARVSFPRTTWVDPRDVAQSPALWKTVEQSSVSEGVGINNLAHLAGAMVATIPQRTPSPYTAPVNEPTPPPVTAKPDVKRVIALATQTGDPVFAFPETQYPSYADIRRLVELSGFKTVDFKHIDAFGRSPLIVVGPEPIPDLNGLRMRVICWQLEYAGDYTNNYKDFTGEVWSSDATWAKANNAKYVLLGSHPNLSTYPNSFYSDADGKSADVTMLGYMTPRRQAIKDKLSTVRWTADYPGHDNEARHIMLAHTTLMLHVHQHENAAYTAPQRIAVAAAYRMPVVSEMVADAGDLAGYVTYADYDKLPAAVSKVLKKPSDTGLNLFKLLCIEKTFRACVEEALKS